MAAHSIRTHGHGVFDLQHLARRIAGKLAPRLLAQLHQSLRAHHRGKGIAELAGIIDVAVKGSRDIVAIEDALLSGNQCQHLFGFLPYQLGIAPLSLSSLRSKASGMRLRRVLVSTDLQLAPSAPSASNVVLFRKDEAMARRSIQERLRQLEARRDALVARLGREQRARDTRRKILIGALVLDRIERQPERYLASRLDDWLRAELPGFLTRENDRALFEDILGSDISMSTSNPSSPSSDGEDRS